MSLFSRMKAIIAMRWKLFAYFQLFLIHGLIYFQCLVTALGWEQTGHGDTWFCNKMTRAVSLVSLPTLHLRTVCKASPDWNKTALCERTTDFPNTLEKRSACCLLLPLLCLSHCIIWCPSHHKLHLVIKALRNTVFQMLHRLGGRNPRLFIISKSVFM